VLDGLPDGRFQLQSPPAVFEDIVITGSSNGEGAPTIGAYGDIRRLGRRHLANRSGPSTPSPGRRRTRRRHLARRGLQKPLRHQRLGLLHPRRRPPHPLRPPRLPPPTTSTAPTAPATTSTATRSWPSTPAPGKKLWHQQLVHHDIWDYDLAAPPAPFDIRRKRPNHPGRRADHQNGPALHLQPPHRRTRLRHGGAADSPLRHPRRGFREDAALPRQAPAALPPRLHRKRHLRPLTRPRQILPRALHGQPHEDRRRALRAAGPGRQRSLLPVHARRRQLGRRLDRPYPEPAMST
jgi:hypothetical protein